MSKLQCNAPTWKEPKEKNLFQRYRMHKLYDMMLTGLLRRCCQRGSRTKGLGLHFRLFRIAVFLCLLLFCVLFFLINEKSVNTKKDKETQTVLLNISPPPPPQLHALQAVHQSRRQGAPPQHRLKAKREFSNDCLHF